MGDLFKKLDEIMTGDLVRKVGGLVCLVAVVVVGLGFIVGAKSVLNTMRPAVTVEATDEETAEDGEDESEDVEEEDDEDDYDE